MPRVNPFSGLRPVERHQETRTFADPAQPGADLELTLLGPDPMTWGDIYTVEVQMIERYLGKDGRGGFPFVLDGKAQRTTAAFWRVVAQVHALQAPAEITGYMPYEPEEVAALAFRYPTAWPHVITWAQQILTGARADLPNASGAAAEDATAPRSPEEDFTPNSPTDGTPRLTALTSD